MMRPRAPVAVLVAAGLSLGSCATAPTPPPASAGPQPLRITTHHWDHVGPKPPSLGWGTAPLPGSDLGPLAGAHCTATNDRGSWTVVTPGEIQVTRSLAPLVVTCRHEGYRDESVELRCITPRARAGMGAAMMIQLFPLALPVVIGAMATLDADVCSYVDDPKAPVQVTMKRTH